MSRPDALESLLSRFGRVFPDPKLTARSADDEVLRRAADNLPRLILVVRLAPYTAAVREGQRESATRRTNGIDPPTDGAKDRPDGVRILREDFMPLAFAIDEIKRAEVGI